MSSSLVEYAIDAAPTRPKTHQLTTFDQVNRNKVIMLPRGHKVTAGEVEGCGYISNLWITFPGWFWRHWDPYLPVSQSILKTLILRIYWDGAEAPAIEAPAGDFFGAGLCEPANFASKYVGFSSGGFFCKFLMPYSEGFRIEFENLDESIDTEVFVNAIYQQLEPPWRAPVYLHAQFHTARRGGADPALIANLRGQGSYLGCTLSMQGLDRNYLSFLEAPEYVYLDDDWDTPRFTGTGLEDYFLGGWYFREGCFTGPLHGVPIKDALNAKVAMYRFHEADAINFERRFRMLFVNPWEPERLRPYAYSSVAYAYVDAAEGQGTGLPFREELLCWYRVGDGDHQSIP